MQIPNRYLSWLPFKCCVSLTRQTPRWLCECCRRFFLLHYSCFEAVSNVPCVLLLLCSLFAVRMVFCLVISYSKIKLVRRKLYRMIDRILKNLVETVSHRPHGKSLILRFIKKQVQACNWPSTFSFLHSVAGMKETKTVYAAIQISIHWSHDSNKKINRYKVEQMLF